MAKNKHDLLFRKTFSDIKMFRTFCDIHLPQDLKDKINLDKLKLRKLSGNFIRTQIILNHGEQALKDKQKYQELKEDIADIVYSAELIAGGEVLLILHVEHQSKPDRLYPLRNALYDISAVKDYVDQHKSKNLPVPISLLYYHGKKSPYPHTIDIMEMFSNKEIADHRFLKPFLVDLGQFTDQELLSHKEIGGFEISYKHTYDQCISEENVVNLVQALRNCNNIELQRAWYRYTINTWDAEKDSMLNIYKEIIPDGEDFAMTVAEQLKKEGKIQGIQEKAHEMAIKMLKLGDSIEKVASVSDLPKIKVQELKNSLKH